MKVHEVPQDDSVLAGLRRACYAEDGQGRYVVVPSRGWEVERIVNEQAHKALRQVLEDTRQAVLEGRLSALAYHMVHCQMDARLLAANAGLCRWRVRRHLKPSVFARLGDDMKQRYAMALGVSVQSLNQVPQDSS
ncbi:MAG: hypothetical protein M0Z76_05395 [Gammaproteobacteria bacterium]|nr:hypothetical protein [Gammaproteobacteria bacterium]